MRKSYSAWLLGISCFSGLNRGSSHVTWYFKVKSTTFDALRALSTRCSHMEMNLVLVLYVFLQQLRKCARLPNATAAAIGYCTHSGRAVCLSAVLKNAFALCLCQNVDPPPLVASEMVQQQRWLAFSKYLAINMTCIGSVLAGGVALVI